MNLIALTPRQALNKAYLKIKPSRVEIELFKVHLISLLDKSNDLESEEFHKKLVSDFLSRTYYHPSHYINTKGFTDLVVHNGNDPTSTVGIILEAKKPTNKPQMVRPDSLNMKAFQELVLYYLRERFGKASKNLEVRHLIVTNSYEWFIFDASLFEKEFAQNKGLVKQFHDFEEGRLSGKTTDFFYREIAAPAIAAITSEVKFTYFDVRDYETALRNNDLSDDAKLVCLYKVISPQHLLKLPFANDSNTLHRGFYAELLNIIGLAETKDATKRLISRKDVKQRHPGSLIENTIVQLDSLGKLARVSNPGRFGDTKEERLFNIALELVITWVNRILFLKLLEAQLISFQKDADPKAFLDIKSIPTFDSLNSLFFQVLAREPSQREDAVKKPFAQVPYLNSSLFEPTELEHETVLISNLQDDRQLPVMGATVLKDARGKRRLGNMGALEYMFQFLDAYDFASDGATEIQEDSKSLISASVLGLIFEKINGYKDGSFFTPGFITMHMCREIVRRAVVQRFNTEKGWTCASIEDLYEKIDDRAEANAIINSVRICDPAVGSGHFLVSALNEIIALKSELRLLQDQSGKRLKEYHVDVVNDELIVTDEDGDFFEYRPANKESQRIQEALFQEKRVIIESCLFGVDINPNSVNICRLRLWIELLKSAYYKPDNELETLPNIDINIKCGNSLISRFPLDADLGKVLKRKKLRVIDYRKAVRTYQNAESKDEKREMQTFIDQLKGDFSDEILDSDPKVKRLRTFQADLATSQNQHVLFDESQKEQRAKASREIKLQQEIDKLLFEIELIKSNRIFQNAFEWRFEFPEVLSDDGFFVGFDAVIGNPPYGVSIKGLERQHLISSLKKVPDFEIYYWFINRAAQVLRPGGTLGYIIPNTILFNVGAASYRIGLFEEWRLDEVLDCTNIPVFVDAAVRNAVVTFTKASGGRTLGYRETKDVGDFADLVAKPLLYLDKEVAVENNQNWGLLFKLEQDVLQLVRRMRLLPTVDEHFSASQGYIPYRQSDLIKTHGAEGAKEIVEERRWHADNKVNDEYLEEIWGKSLSRYGYSNTGSFVQYGRHLAGYIDMKFFNQHRLLVREITNPSIVACVVDDIFVNDPQIIAVIPKSGDYSVDFLWAVFNSKLARFYHFNASPKATKGLFPKILVLDINKFPLPPEVSDETKVQLDGIVKKAFDIKKTDADADVGDVERQIDSIVYSVYQLTKTEIDLIESNWPESA